MMGFFTHFYKKVRVLALGLALGLFGLQAFAASSNIAIKSAELMPAGEAYKLNIYAEITLGSKVEEAVNKGVPLTFVYEFQLKHPRKYWFDDEIVTKSTQVTLSYHALSRQYLVSQNGHQTAYEILSEALIELIQFDDWKVLDQSMLEKGLQYSAAVLVKLDRNKLPKALQVEALGSDEWNLVSEKYEWEPKNLSLPEGE